MDVTQGIRRFVGQKAKSTVAKLGQKVIGVKVFLENIARKKNDSRRSRATVQLEIPGEDIVVKEESHDPYQAIIGSLKAAARQLRKKKEKRISKTRRKS